MCHKIITISKVKSGIITKCNHCQNYHLTFNNIYFEFNRKQLIKFRDKILEINPDSWEKSYSNLKGKRKIPIQTLHQNLFLIFDREELNELKSLLSINEKFKHQLINLDDIDYTLVLN
jgi:hypothetical protein